MQTGDTLLGLCAGTYSVIIAGNAVACNNRLVAITNLIPLVVTFF
ncbi:MAG: hypothetical protein R2847_11230 [Bacteroidia bacterium]